jgi:hypothetical protein
MGEPRAVGLKARPSMRAERTMLLAAVAMHVLGWWLPVARDYRGWQAFRVALSPLWPYEQFQIEPGLLLVLSVASALTNVLFVGLAAVLLLGRDRRARAVLWAAAGATLLDLHWPISMGAERVALQSGYFVWVTSFALLAFAAFLAARDRR